MKLIDNIKRSAWNFYFQKEKEKLERNRKVFNLNEAKHIAIIYDASDESTYKKVSEFVRFLQNDKKQVKALGFLKFKTTPHYCIPMLSYDFVLANDINWYYKPGNKFVTDFLAEDFDLLIDLNLEENLSLKYIAGLSKASFKVGVYGENHESFYDLMIKFDSNQNLNEYLKQIIHYLTIINSDSNAS